MAPARRLEDGAGASAGGVQLAVAAIGVSLQNAAVGGQMAMGMFPRAVARVEVKWSRLSEQIFRVDKWSVCRG